MSMSPYFKSGQEAMLMGMFVGTLVSKGIQAFPEVDDQGYYTDVIGVVLEFEETTQVVHLRWVPASESG